MSTESIILVLLGTVQTIGLGVSGFIASKVVSLGETVARLTQAQQGGENAATEFRTRLAEQEARLTRFEIELTRIKALMEGANAP